MTNRFEHYSPSPLAGAVGAYAVTPSDTDYLPEAIRMVTLGGSGTLSFVGTDGKTYQTANLPIGSYAVSATRISATGTTAQNITGWA